MIATLTVNFDLWIQVESGEPPTSADMSEIADSVSQDLLSRDDLELLDVATDAHDGFLGVAFQIQTADLSDLLAPTPEPYGVMRSALHAAHVGTQGWDGKSAWMIKGIKSHGESSNVSDLQDA